MTARDRRPGNAPNRLKPRRSRLGNLLVVYRSMRLLDIRTLAKDIGLSAATLSRIERGHAMDAATLIRVWTWLLESEQAK